MSEKVEKLLREYRERTTAPPDDSEAAWRRLMDSSLAARARARNALMGGLIAAFLCLCLGRAHFQAGAEPGTATARRATGAGGSEGSSGTPGTGGMRAGAWSAAGDDA